MDRRLAFVLSVAALAATAAVRGEDDEWTLPPDAPRLKAGPGVEQVLANCVLCHSTDYISTQPPLTRDQWKATVTKMQQKFGAPLQLEKLEPLLDYLAKTYGK